MPTTTTTTTFPTPTTDLAKQGRQAFERRFVNFHDYKWDHLDMPAIKRKSESLISTYIRKEKGNE